MYIAKNLHVKLDSIRESRMKIIQQGSYEVLSKKKFNRTLNGKIWSFFYFM